ncbi:hypothetical protein D0Y65_053742 [Glycine soja]|uniref:Uncharacterized protein n=1 Tax=Glycine soja TaxID=3848 RepID=A0A445F3D5_GLYSO|nr:hypothetical protein D0Y65_053742 [Glycine soja]
MLKFMTIKIADDNDVKASQSFGLTEDQPHAYLSTLKAEPIPSTQVQLGVEVVEVEKKKFKELTGKNYANQSLGTCLITLEENHADDINYLENPLYGKFKIKGLPFAHKLTKLFKDVVANGKFQWALSFGILPAGVKVDMDDGYHQVLRALA